MHTFSPEPNIIGSDLSSRRKMSAGDLFPMTSASTSRHTLDEDMDIFNDEEYGSGTRSIFNDEEYGSGTRSIFYSYMPAIQSG